MKSTDSYLDSIYLISLSSEYYYISDGTAVK